MEVKIYRKKVKVTIVNDEHIITVSSSPRNGITSFQSHGLQYALNNNFRSSKTVTSIGFCNTLPPLQEEIITVESEVIFKPTAIVDDEFSNLAERTFGFQTPTKKTSNCKIDSASKLNGCYNSPKTPRSSRHSYKTPKIKHKTSSNSKISPTVKLRRLSTPTRNGRTTPTSAATTPYSLRKKVKKHLSRASINDDSDDEYDDSDVDGHYSPSDSDESEAEEVVDINDNNTPMKMLRGLMKKSFHSPMRTPRRGRIHKVDIDMVATSDDYFSHNSDPSSCVTSDHTLNRLENPRLGPDILKEILKDVYVSHEQEKEDIIDDHISLFPHWMTLLFENYSIFLCGIGSKKKLLSLFQQKILEDVDHVVLNGFFPSLTLKSIMVTILEDIMGLNSIPQSTNEQLHIIRLHYDKGSAAPLVLVINNLDGPMLRLEKTQRVLSLMASFKNIHVIASIDHINAPLIFDASKSSSYNPLWFDATTLAPYSEETSYENSLMVQQSGALALSSLIHVFRSLTPNAKGIFLLLARFQLDQRDNSDYNGMSFNDLYQRSRENFLVNSDLTLRAQLTEFRDHKLIKTKKNNIAIEYLIIPLESSTLDEFLENQQD